MAKAKQQNYLHGAAIMTAGVIIMKILGALYKIPLGNMLGDDGYGLFLQAYYVYSLFLTLATAGFPVALSRMISAAQTADAGAPYISRGMVDILCPRRCLLDGNVRVPRLACRHSYKQSRCRFQHPGSRTGGAPVLHHRNLQRTDSGLRQHDPDHYQPDTRGPGQGRGRTCSRGIPDKGRL